MTTQPNTEKIVLSVDSQILSKIQTCNQQAAYRHLDNIEPIDYDNSSLELGLILHEGLAEHYTHVNKIDYKEVQTRAIARMEAFAPAKTSIEREGLNMVIDAYVGYAKHYQTESWVVATDPVTNNRLVEKTFARILYDTPEVQILYTGVTDLVLQHDEAKLYMPVDHKSFSSYYGAAVNSNQFHGYAWALNAKNLIVNRVGLKGKLGKYERVVVTFHPARIEEWKRDAIEDIMYHYEQMGRGYFRRNREACENYGGCRFKKLCLAQPEHRAWLMKNEYKVMPEWSPLNRD